MAKQITDKPATFCFKDCPLMDLDVQSTPLYAYDRVHYTHTIMKCKHEDVCQMWAEKTCQKLCPECDYNDDQCSSNPIECYPVVRRKTNG